MPRGGCKKPSWRYWPVAASRDERERCGNAGAVESVESPTAGFPRFPRAPWKSRQRQARFPHSHSAGDEGGWKSGKPKAGFPLSHRLDSSLSKSKTQDCGASPRAAKTQRKEAPQQYARTELASEFQARPALEWTCRFRLISRWNQFPFSGSFLDWKMLID